jgi:hypothetical protein
MGKWQRKRKPNKSGKEDSSPRTSNDSQPFKRSDGYWYVWINDGRGGYDQILSRSEQDRLDNHPPDYFGDR